MPRQNIRLDVTNLNPSDKDPYIASIKDSQNLIADLLDGDHPSQKPGGSRYNPNDSMQPVGLFARVYFSDGSEEDIVDGIVTKV